MRLGKAETAFIVFALVLCGIIVIYNAVSAPPLDAPVAYYQTSDLDSSYEEKSDDKSDVSSFESEQSSAETSDKSSSFDISAADVSSSVDATSVEASKTIINGKININTATKEELMTLDGIGEIFAERIIEYREKNGGFLSVDELKNVQGIGDKRFNSIEDKITIG